MGQNKSQLTRIAIFAISFVLLASLAAVREGRIFGISIRETEGTENQTEKQSQSTEIDTSQLGKQITGYAGPVPVKIYITGERIDSITLLPNSETQSFVERVERSGLLNTWDGKSLQEAADMPADAVSGATYTSNAVIENVRAGIADLIGKTAAKRQKSTDSKETAKWIIVVTVILAGAVIPLITKNRKYRIVQQLLDVGILGFWAGTFIDYAMMINIFANGIRFGIAGITTTLLMAIGFIYPLAGKQGYYCAWICPYGALQELASDCCKRRVKITANIAKSLNTLREALWVALLIMLFTGWGASWIDYEIFTGFIVEAASWTVIATGIVFVGISFVIPRAFCRFVCPTGTLLKLGAERQPQKTSEKRDNRKQ